MRVHGQHTLEPPPSRRARLVPDTLSGVLGAVRLARAVFFNLEASPPFGVRTPGAADLARHGLANSHVIQFYLVKSGPCRCGVTGEAPRELEPGDIVVFLRGDEHALESTTGALGPVELVCGLLRCDAGPMNPLLATLPRLLVLTAKQRSDGAIDRLVELALLESAVDRAGAQGVLARLGELLLMEIVRRHAAIVCPEPAGWFAGLADENIGRALGKLHERPAHAWSLELLAQETGMSRSALAEHFCALVGVPPMQYLTQWRMQLAATLLSTTTLRISEIGERVGYASEAALSRAYKRWSGVWPAEWRRGRRS
jgi:AraC-like DNA-binding protein